MGFPMASPLTNDAGGARRRPRIVTEMARRSKRPRRMKRAVPLTDRAIATAVPDSSSVGEDVGWKTSTSRISSGTRKTDWLRAKPIPAKRITRNQEIGRGRVRYSELIWEPSGRPLDTRRGRCGPVAKRLDSWERKKMVRRLLTERYSAARKR